MDMPKLIFETSGAIVVRSLTLFLAAMINARIQGTLQPQWQR